MNTPDTKPTPKAERQLTAKPITPPADPHKTAIRLDEVDALKLENFTLRVNAVTQQLQALQTAQQSHVNDVIAKYQADGETISLQPDGRTIVRTKKGK